MSIGRARGANVLEGDSLRFSDDEIGRIGEVDLPRDGTILLWSCGMGTRDGF